jgi:UDPglucose 6-dehydrogenase
LRDSPALDIAARLLSRGAKVRVHDPVALDRARTEHSQIGVEYCDSLECLAEDADALFLATEWPQYQSVRWDALAPSMRVALILDARNFFDRAKLTEWGFRYIGMGS